MVFQRLHAHTMPLGAMVEGGFGALIRECADLGFTPQHLSKMTGWPLRRIKELGAAMPLPDFGGDAVVSITIRDLEGLTLKQAELRIAEMLLPVMLDVVRNDNNGTIIDRKSMAEDVFDCELTFLRRIERRALPDKPSPHGRCRKRSKPEEPSPEGSSSGGEDSSGDAGAELP